MRRQALLFAALLAMLTATTSYGSLTLSLSSPAPDLLALTPGDTLTIDVGLIGMVPGDTLDFLAATVVFDGTILGPPTVTEGAIVPDSSGFLTVEAPELADGSYDIFFSFSGDPIVDNGTFFSFDVSVIGTGAGTLSFDFVDSFGVDGAFFPLPTVIAGPPLAYESSAGEYIPEPSSICVWSLIGVVGMGFGWRRHRRR